MARPNTKEKKGVASYADAVKQAQRWDTVVLRCRTRGHSWEQDLHHPDAGKVGREWHVFFLCTRECGVSKKEVWNSRGRILRSTMSYPRDTDGHPAYLSEIGYIDADAKGALRLALLEMQ